MSTPALSLPGSRSALATLILLLSSERLEPWPGGSLKIFRMVGEASYSLYLWHVPVGCWIVIKFFDALGWRRHGRAAHLACDLTALGICSVWAAILYHRIERPAIAWGRRLSTANLEDPEAESPVLPAVTPIRRPDGRV
jgi:peptidoglycan/LPS O-acetylase OafA/YrhL